MWMILLLVAFPEVLANCPQNCVCNNTEVMCENLQKLPVSLPSNIESFTSRSNLFTTIPAGYFTRSKYPNLRSISFIQGNIKRIEKNAFYFLSHVTNITIKQNNLTSIDSEVFNALSLSYLDLSFNSISSITKDAFIRSRQLKELNLQGNQIKSIDVPIFPNAIIRRVDLTDNFLPCSCAASRQLRTTFQRVSSILGNCKQYNNEETLSLEVIRKENGPCQNGTCSNLDQCDCKDRYIGRHCGNVKPICYENGLCGNNGLCMELGSNDKVCKCVNGYSGKFCTIKPTSCSSKLCNDHGACVWNGDGNFSCSCFENYSGNRCLFENVVTEEKNGAVTGVLIAGAIICVILLLLIGIFFVLQRKYQRNNPTASNDFVMKNKEAEATAEYYSTARDLGPSSKIREYVS